MAPEPVQPLRINKSPPKNAPTSMSRPLSEISPMGIRRNSPSFNQVTGKPSLASQSDSSPFDASPENQSPRNFWKTKEVSSPARRDSENSPLRNLASSSSSSPTRRSSLEKLKNASRVTNSSMFAREHESDYDPASSPVIERPLVSARPLSVQVQGNAFMGTGLDSSRAANPSFRSGHKRSESNTDIPKLSPTLDLQSSPFSSLHSTSPQKSSLLNLTRFASTTDLLDTSAQDNTETGSRANTPRSLRQAKSVTFDNAPPQINEYEMITPDPSSIASGSREGSYDSDPFDIDEDLPGRPETPSDREDSFDESLEDTEKTPVVLPEDWRFMNPDSANTHLANTFDDPFAHRPALSSPSSRYRPTPERDTAVARSSSNNSNGEHRPLPPLPPGGGGSAIRDSSPKSTRASPPRPASVSKAEILGMRSSPMPLDERLRLLSIENERQSKQQQQQAALQSGSTTEVDQKHETSPSDDSQHTEQNEYKPPARVSRESILRNLNSQKLSDFQFDDSELVQAHSSEDDGIDYANLDPDEPIPSCEVETSPTTDCMRNTSLRSGSDDGSVVDMYARPATDNTSRSASPSDEYAIDSSVIHYEIPETDMSEVSNESLLDHATPMPTADGAVDPDATERELATPVPELKPSFLETSRMSLPEFTSIFSKDDFDFGLESYLTPTSENTFKKELNTEPQVNSPLAVCHVLSSEIQLASPTPSTPSASVLQLQDSNAMDKDITNFAMPEKTASEDDAGSPASVIHHPAGEDSVNQSPSKSSEAVPEPIATIKAAGTKLKTRMSATPADLHMMSATRRQISGEQPTSVNEANDNNDAITKDDESLTDTGNFFEGMSASRRESLQMKLDVPLLSPKEPDLGIGEEFDRLLEAKKKGYLMRQNTKVVVASHLNPNSEQENGTASTRDAAQGTPGLDPEEANTSIAEPTAASGRRASTTWTTEPWNGRIRRHSTRRSNIVPDMRLQRGAAPPLPGQESAVNEGLDKVNEDQYDEDDESGERGRVFVKVVGVKDLDLPLPKNEPSYFQMTLDNGLHCVTTSWSELARNAPIGQEFELVVFEDLEFQLTLQTKLERPKSSATSVVSNTPSVEAKKQSALSRMFTSPKKRREREQKQREEELQANKLREMELEAQRAVREPSAWDLQNELVGADGSFARAYVCLSNHEQQAFGRPLTVDIPCWNEWAAEDKSVASTRSKNGGVQRKPPYRIGNMELQLLYIPRPRDIDEEEMPKSMASAMRQLKEAEAITTREFQGHLSQQGGDCPYWRRRFFKLHGSKLTAYHDFTRQPRATISLAKATKLIDDKSSLTKPDPGSPAKGKGRRKSAFAEEEEGYMFVEEGFRIRFQNGEVIDFYADNSEDKERWMKVLSEAIGRENPQERKTWMSLVLAKERAAAATAARTASKSSTSSKSKIPTSEQTLKQNASKPPSASPQKVVTGTVPSKKPAFSVGGAPKENKSFAGEQPARASVPSASTSKPSSPVKPWVSPTKQSQSAVKQKAQSPVKEYQSPSKRNSGVAPALSPRKLGKEITGKRQGVRSMIF